MSGSISKSDLKDVRKSQATNLRFLDRFLKTMKWSKPQFAEKIGMTKANVYHWFKVDDIQLTTLNSAFEKIGYEVIFNMDMPKKRGEETINIEIDQQDVNDSAPKKRLSFLRHALYDNDIDQNVLAKKLGIDVETIDYWFRHDKCYISYFFLIAKYTGSFREDIHRTRILRCNISILRQSICIKN
jgi:DNA-binding transcriptional regulator YiaG